MRKSVTIGFGLWLIAVVTVAGVASVAIQTAGRQVTSVEITAAVPDISPEFSPDSVSTSAPDPTPSADPDDVGTAVLMDSSAAKVPATSARPPATTTRSAPETTRSAPVTNFGSFGSAGGRLRVSCTGSAVSLDGGFARPEPGWSVRVDGPRPAMILVLFWNRTRAITVASQCSDGRPDFTERIFLLRDGAAPPAQVGQPIPAPEVMLAPVPTSSAAVTTPGPPAPNVDPAQITAYVQVQNDQCAQVQWASDWCSQWGALSDEQRTLFVWRWLLTVVSPSSATDGGSSLNTGTPVATGNLPLAS